MPHLPPARHKTSKHYSPNETKEKQKQNKTISDSNSNLAKSMTHHNQTKELTTWFLSFGQSKAQKLSSVQSLFCPETEFSSEVELRNSVTLKPFSRQSRMSNK
jgi:hypothetical protein